MRTRPLIATDQGALWDLLHVALWDPPPAPPRPRAVLDDPRVRIYAEGWGRSGDVGVVAELPDATPIGACWMRLLREGQGLAFIDEATPQLGIALFPSFQHRGYGGPLMHAALVAAAEAGYRQVSLTVHPENPALRLYERCGFRRAGLRGTYVLMTVALASERHRVAPPLRSNPR
jgi:ribosomal protein S18 acetylase RimI-like enzyme